MNEVSFDQHFLKNEKILEFISECIGNISKHKVIEIGGGRGALTKYIIEKNPKEFVCVEIDEKMIEQLVLIFESNNYSLIHENVLDYLKSLKQGEVNVLVGNIPYSITQQLIVQLFFLVPQKVVFLQPHSTTKTLMNNETKQAQLLNALYSISCEKVVNGDNFEPLAHTQSSIMKLELKDKSSLLKKELFLIGLTKRYNQTFYNAVVYSLAEVLEVGKKEIKKKLEDQSILFPEEKLNVVSNEDFNNLVDKVDFFFNK